MKKNMFPRCIREMMQGLKILPGDFYSQTMFRKHKSFLILISVYMCLLKCFEQFKTFFFLNDTRLVQTPVNEH